MTTFRSGLGKTRRALFGRISQVLGNTEIEEDTWDDIEALLIQADIGVPTATELIERLQGRVKREGLTSIDGEQVESLAEGSGAGARDLISGKLVQGEDVLVLLNLEGLMMRPELVVDQKQQDESSD